MNVLFVSNEPQVFDEQSPVRARMRAYAAAIGNLHILSPAPGGSRRITEGPLTLHPIPRGRLAALMQLTGRARVIIQEEGIEVVSAQDPFEHGYAARKAVRGTSARLHIQVHTDFLSPWFVRSGGFRSARVPVPFTNHVRRYLANQVLPHADAVRAVSVRVRDSLVARYGNRIPVPSVLPIAVDAAVPATVPLPEHSSQFTLITVGRLEPEKRIEDILYALARIGYQNQMVGLVIVGSGSELPRLRTLSKRLGLTERVIFAGAEWQHARGMMRSANAYIQASAYEGYGRTLIEAALARIPIITTDVGIVGDVFTGYDDVLAAPPGDPAALATHIRGLVSDHQARELLIINAEKKAEEHLRQFSNLPGMIRDDLARAVSGR